MPVTNRVINISKRYTEEERKAIAFEIISYIQERTKKGLGKDKKPWGGDASKYTKGYKESLDFKNAGKTSKVDLTLTGDMLDSLDLLSDEQGKLVIGISPDDEDHGKAEGNITGSYGKPRGNKSKARDFLALSKEEVNNILKDFPLKDDETREESVAAFIAAVDAAKKLIKGKKVEELTIGQLII